jgi:Uma2 family endonuclease
VGKPYDDDDGFGGPGGWWIFLEVDVRLSSYDVVRPDLAGWRRERLPDPGMQRPIDIAPDWVCEILSPTSVTRDRVDKRRLYAEAKLPHYWIVDPEARTLEAQVLEQGRWVLSGSYDDTASVRIPPFEEVELAVGRLFLPAVAPPAEEEPT